MGGPVGAEAGVDALNDPATIAIPEVGLGDGIVIGPDFVRFNQRDDIFNRSDWDVEVSGPKARAFYEGYFMSGAKARAVEGFTVWDYAYRNASWHIADVFADLKRDDGRHEGFTDLFTAHRPGSDQPLPVANPAAMTMEVKRIAKSFGAGLVGVARFDERRKSTTISGPPTR